MQAQGRGVRLWQRDGWYKKRDETTGWVVERWNDYMNFVIYLYCYFICAKAFGLCVFTVVFVLDQYILRDLEKKKILVFTPSRRVGGKRVVCYDDRFIVKLAHESDGIVVSNDTYRDLQNERPEWKKFIEESLLMYSFVNDKYVPILPLLLKKDLCEHAVLF